MKVDVIHILIVLIVLVAAFFYYDKKGQLAFWIAKRKAIKGKKSTGKKHYILPGRNKLHVVNTSQLNRINRKLPKSRKLNIKKLLEDSYFWTK